MHITPRVARTQPRGIPNVNWSNPLTRGLVFLVPLTGGQDLIDVVGQKRALSGKAGVKATSKGLFTLFPAPTTVTFPTLSGVIGPTTPATIGWIQQPVNPTTYNSVLQIGTGTNAFMIYESTTDSKYYFTAGIRGTNTVANFGSSIGPMVNGKVDTFVLTSLYGLGYNTGLTLFRGNDKYAPTGVATFNGGNNDLTFIGSSANDFCGTLGCVAIWNRVLSDEEARSYNANPWQLFMPALSASILPTGSTTRRALIMLDGQISQVVDALIGVGKKPLVLYNGVVQERVSDEGIPLILDNGQLRTLATNESLVS